MGHALEKFHRRILDPPLKPGNIRLSCFRESGQALLRHAALSSCPRDFFTDLALDIHIRSYRPLVRRKTDPMLLFLYIL